MAAEPVYSKENEQRIKIFLSWSGDKSKKLANVFKTYVADILPKADFYFSPDDLKGGEKWRQSIEEGLNNNTYGIIFLTPSNLTSKWIYFEAGAISKSTKQAKILPFLYKIDVTELGQPFSDYQCKSFSTDDILTTIHEINDCQSKVYQLPSETIKRNFNRLSNEIKTEIEEINNISEVIEKSETQIEDASLMDSEDKINEILQIIREQSSNTDIKKNTDIERNTDNVLTHENLKLINYLSNNKIFSKANEKDDLAIVIGRIILGNRTLSNNGIKTIEEKHKISIEELQSILNEFNSL